MSCKKGTVLVLVLAFLVLFAWRVYHRGNFNDLDEVHLLNLLGKLQKIPNEEIIAASREYASRLTIYLHQIKSISSDIKLLVESTEIQGTHKIYSFVSYVILTLDSHIHNIDSLAKALEQSEIRCLHLLSTHKDFIDLKLGKDASKQIKTLMEHVTTAEILEGYLIATTAIQAIVSSITTVSSVLDSVYIHEVENRHQQLLLELKTDRDLVIHTLKLSIEDLKRLQPKDVATLVVTEHLDKWIRMLENHVKWMEGKLGPGANFMAKIGL